jgi:hypothetical protein
MLGSQQSMLAEMFNTNVRYTGMAFLQRNSFCGNWRDAAVRLRLVERR